MLVAGQTDANHHVCLVISEGGCKLERFVRFPIDDLRRPAIHHAAICRYEKGLRVDSITNIPFLSGDIALLAVSGYDLV